MLWDWLRRQAALDPHRPYVDHAAGPRTFGDWDASADGVAARLSEAGVRPGDRVAAAMAAGPGWVALVWALIRLRATLVPMNARLTDGEMLALLADASPSLLVVDGTRPTLNDTVSERLFLLREDDLAASPGPVWTGAEPAPGDVQSIIYTSGTTGRPKGACIRLEQHWWNALGSALRLGTALDDVWLLTMPLYHVGGQAILFRAAIGGHRVLLAPRFDPKETATLLDDGGVTLVSLVPTMLRRVLDVHPDPFRGRLRAVLIGGAACPPSLAQEASQRGLPIVLTYGMTETASQLATATPETSRRGGHVGRPLWAVRLRVAEPDAEGVGEIQVAGPQVTSGYWNRPEETRARFVGDDTQGWWFRTGDLGRLEPDGSLVVVDRRDDLIVSGGENIYPAEVEAVVAQHAAVREVGVAGVPHGEWGQVPAAWLVLRTPVSDADLEAHCRARLAGYKVPRKWVRVKALPVTANGKVRRDALRSWDPEALP